MWFARCVSTMRMAFLSSPLLGAPIAAIITIGLAPLLEILGMFLLGSALHSPNPGSIFVRAIIMCTVATTAMLIATTIAHDRACGVLTEVVTRRHLDSAYFVAIALFAGGVSSTSAGISALALWVAMPPSISVISASLPLFPIAIALGVGLGLCASTAVFLWSDPYIVLNLLVPFLPIALGTIVPISLYPQPFGSLLHYVPLARSLESLTAASLRYDAFCCVVLLVIATGTLVLVGRQSRKQGSLPSL